jgi:hypothetical protein
MKDLLRQNLAFAELVLFASKLSKQDKWRALKIVIDFGMKKIWTKIVDKRMKLKWVLER